MFGNFFIPIFEHVLHLCSQIHRDSSSHSLFITTLHRKIVEFSMNSTLELYSFKALRAKRAGLSKPNWSEKLKNVKSEAKVPKSDTT